MQEVDEEVGGRIDADQEVGQADDGADQQRLLAADAAAVAAAAVVVVAVVVGAVATAVVGAAVAIGPAAASTAEAKNYLIPDLKPIRPADLHFTGK